MVSSTAIPSSSSVSGHILSTVVPANVTGDLLHPLSPLDLAFKLHYLRTTYYFNPSDPIQTLTVVDMKQTLFLMLDVYPQAAGRVRRHEATGRPHLKCNDSGVRIVEARCERTMEEWLGMEMADRSRELVYDRVLGPDLYFSPLVYVQFTRFKCGGLAVGINWAHVLADAVSASNSFNLWGQIMATNQPVHKTQNQQEPDNKITSPATEAPLSVKKVDPVGDFWLTSTNLKMATISFQISESKLKNLQSKISGNVPTFEAISALIWQNLAKFRTGEKEPNLVTIVRNDTAEERKHVLGNKQIISMVTTDSSAAKLELTELAMLISKCEKDETKAIETMVESENGKDDYIVYGANLTFVDMQGIDLYGLELKGQKPTYVDYNIHGVGEKGAVLVLPGPNEGKVLTMILPEDEILKIKEELGSGWNIA